MSYIIGVDGGGTGCRVAVANSAGAVLGRAEGGAANIATDFDFARANILQTVASAFENAGLPQAEIGAATAVLGIAGANLGDFNARLLASLPFAKTRVISDAETTLVGAMGEVDGVIGAIGTGSVFGRREHGVFTQIGGWGFLLGDDGSGARLGRDILHLTILASDGLLPHSPLTRAIIDEFEGSPLNLVDRAQAYTPKEFGQFAPRIVAAANDSDEHAESILMRHTEIVRKSIDAAGFDEAKSFCMLGGLGKVFLKRLPPRYQKAASTPLGNALDGAVTLALSFSKL